MDASFSLVLHNTTKITLNERFSNLETTCQKIDENPRSVCFVSERFEASKNQRLALQLGSRMRFNDDNTVTLDNVLDDSFAEMAGCSSRKSVAQRLSHAPGRLTEARPSAKCRLTWPAAAAAGCQRPGVADILCTSTVDGAVAGLWTRKRLRAHKKGVVSAPLKSSRVFSSFDNGQGCLNANEAFCNAVSQPANGLLTSSHSRTAVAKVDTVSGRRRRRRQKAKALAVVAPPAQSVKQHKSSRKQSASCTPEGEVRRAVSSAARGRRGSRGAGKVAPDTAALDRELDDYMLHVKLGLA